MRNTQGFPPDPRKLRVGGQVMESWMALTRLATLRVPFLCSLPEGPLHASWSSRPPHSSSPRFRRSRSDISLRLRRGFAKRERENSVQVNLTLFSLSRFAERTRLLPLSHSVAHYRIKHQQDGLKEWFCPFLLHINAFAKPPFSMLSSHLGASFMDEKCTISHSYNLLIIHSPHYKESHPKITPDIKNPIPKLIIPNTAHFPIIDVIGDWKKDSQSDSKSS